MTNAIGVALILGYTFISAFLETESGSRITPAEYMLMGVMLLATVRVLSGVRVAIPSVYVAAIPMLLVFLLGAAFAYHVDRALMELLVIAFGIFGSLAILILLDSMPEEWLMRFVRGYVLTIGALAAICVLDFLLMPGLVSSRQLGGLQGPFRNTGQAGSFFGTHAALLIALVISRVVPRTAPYLFSAAVAVLALVFTVKRAALLGFGIGLLALIVLLMFSPSSRDKRIATASLLIGGVFSVLGFVVYQWAIEYVPGLEWRIRSKLAFEAIEAYSEGFLTDNALAALSAFYDSPLIGVGLDNVVDVYFYREVHSMYFGVLAYGGLVGSLAYLYFMGTMLTVMWREARHKLQNVWAQFLYLLVPLLIGLMVSWGYTYHIRKREFWVLVVFVAIAVRFSRRRRTRYSQHRIEATDFSGGPNGRASV